MMQLFNHVEELWLDNSSWKLMISLISEKIELNCYNPSSEQEVKVIIPFISFAYLSFLAYLILTFQNG